LNQFVQAEQKAQEESQRLRQQEREQMAEKRRRELVINHYSCLYDGIFATSSVQ
jgi:hypothetical protein